MTTTSLKIQLPTTLFRFGISSQDVAQRVAEWLVLSLFTEGQVSSGKAGQLLGISRIEFLALLRKYKIPYVDLTEDELVEEWRSVADLTVVKQE